MPYRQSNDYECPKCGAPPGKNCTLVSGPRVGELSLVNHPERHDKYRQIEDKPSYPGDVTPRRIEPRQDAKLRIFESRYGGFQRPRSQSLWLWACPRPMV